MKEIHTATHTMGVGQCVSCCVYWKSCLSEGQPRSLTPYKVSVWAIPGSCVVCCTDSGCVTFHTTLQGAAACAERCHAIFASLELARCSCPFTSKSLHLARSQAGAALSRHMLSEDE